MLETNPLLGENIPKNSVIIFDKTTARTILIIFGSDIGMRVLYNMVLIESLSFVCPVLKFCFYQNYVIRKLFYSSHGFHDSARFGRVKLQGNTPAHFVRKYVGV